MSTHKYGKNSSDHSAERALLHRVWKSSTLRQPEAGECTFLQCRRVQLIVGGLRVCQDCRVRNKENTLEVILFEYSRRLRGWSQIRGVKRCLVLCISTHKEDIGIEAPMRRISFFAYIGRSHKRKRNWICIWRRSVYSRTEESHWFYLYSSLCSKQSTINWIHRWCRTWGGVLHRQYYQICTTLRKESWS